MKYNVLTILAICFIFMMGTATEAQTVVKSRNSDAKSTAQSDFFSKYWVGGSLELGYSSNGYQSQFVIGISPMIGYKFTDNFSAGPRIVYTYARYKEKIGGSALGVNLHEYGFGAFTRYKFLNTFFVHGEANYQSKPESISYDRFANKLTATNAWNPGLLLGLGYNGGGAEMYILYDFLRDTSGTVEIPIEFRIGFTIGF